MEFCELMILNSNVLLCYALVCVQCKKKSINLKYWALNMVSVCLIIQRGFGKSCLRTSGDVLKWYLCRIVHCTLGFNLPCGVAW